jgi:adenosylcobinamide-GDP ribazoletransferase
MSDIPAEAAEPAQLPSQQHRQLHWQPQQRQQPSQGPPQPPSPDPLQASQRRPRSGWWADLAGAWVFYTVLPLPPPLRPRFERIARFAPWVGAVIGALEALLWQTLTPAGLPVQAALVIAFGLWISGGLHLDGAMDTADGLAAGPERCLEAMDDSRVGASGVQALLLLLLLRMAGLALLAAAAPWALVWAAVWSRVAPLLAIHGFPYLRASGEGLAGLSGTAGFHRQHRRSLPAELSPSLLLLAWLTGLALILATGPWWWLGWIGLVPALLVPWRLGRRLGGHSGDSYGACVEWSASWSLLLMGLGLRFLTGWS